MRIRPDTVRKIREVKNRIKKAISIKSDSGLMFKVNGINQLKLSEGLEIEKIFKDYGITVEWGCKKTETYPSPDRVAEILDVDKSTLWRWPN